MDRSRYFDNAATTPLDPRVLDEMLPYLKEHFGNANSIHSFGATAMAGVDQARQRVASLLGADDPVQVVFTSGATESNNWVLSSYSGGAISPFEHSAVREPALVRGYKVLPNHGPVISRPEYFPDLISVMGVNNETGSIWEPATFRAYARTLHSDITQQLGKIPLDLTGLDYASMSAHKLYGPKGVGALYFESHVPHPFLLGGEQEDGARAGTLNVPGIVGFGAAAAIAEQEMEANLAHVQNLRAIVLDGLRPLSDWQINGGDNVSPYILNISFLGVEGETVVIESDHAGFAISAGAACSSRSTEPSHVLTALGVEEAWLRGTVRISFGRWNSEQSSHDLAKTLLRIIQKLRTM